MTTATEEKTPEQLAQEQAEQAMRDRGEPTTEAVQVDYFGFEETHVVLLPDGISFIEHKTLNEGQRRKYLNGMNRDVIIERASGNAKMSMAPGDERFSLLSTAITGWNLKRAGNPLPFNAQNLRLFLDSAPPKIIDLIDKEVRKVNAWLLEDMSIEDLEKEIENLQELIEEKRKEEAGK